MPLIRERGFDGLYTSVTSQTTWTQPIAIREPAAADRLVVACVGVHQGTAVTFSSVTCFGTALSNAVTTTAAAAFGLTIRWAYVASGQTGDMVVVVDNATPRWVMSVYSFPRASATAAASATDVASPMSQAIAQTAGSIMIAASIGINADVSRPSWFSPLRKVEHTKVGSNLNFSSFKYTSPIAETRTVACDWDLGSVERAAFVVHA
jgi:hypothetical protein